MYQQASHIAAAATPAAHASRCEIKDWSATHPRIPDSLLLASTENSDLCQTAVKRCLEEPSSVWRPCLETRFAGPRAFSPRLADDAGWTKVVRACWQKVCLVPSGGPELFRKGPRGPERSLQNPLADAPRKRSAAV